ncbi:cytochrome c biogenesis protein CcsA [Corallibacter sp.]|uniref:cytochrome c biogenesis protein CcsA n=1 Tax=Corallibacter sp. TaxID=2038084 RepID=UPI003AB5FF01
MQNKLAKILFSTRLTAVLFIVFAAAMATGTFLDAGENTSPTPLTRTLIYNAWWFEAIMVLFVINFIGNIFRYRLHKFEKWPSLILHLAFILILLGAGITRYIGFEGMMAIREGETESAMLSHKTYITTYIDGDYEIDGVPQRLPLEWEVDFSPRLNNSFSKTVTYNNQPVTIELEKFIAGAEKDVVPDETGEEYLKLVEAGNTGAHNHFLKVGQVQSIHNVLFSLNKQVDGAINITYKDDELTIDSPFEGEYMTMATGQTGQLLKDSIQPLKLRSRYIIGNMQVVFPKPVVKGVFDIVKKPQILKGDEMGAVFKVTTGGETKRIKVLGGQGYGNPFEQEHIGGLDIAMKYGSKVIELPFSIKLNDFIADKYPGTESSYSSFESKVTVLDAQEGDFDYHIYMNHILDHRGYRFFQSGFDPDEKGTKLSVNHDFWGTWITYIGYFLLYAGMLAILFVKGSRFGNLRRMLDKVKAKKAKMTTIILLCIGLQGFSQGHAPNDGHDHSVKPSKAQIDSILAANITPKAHADKFGRLVIQDIGGRMMPVNTFASEMLRKLTKHDTYEDFDANQVFLSIQESPLLWYNAPIIYLKYKKDDSIRSIIGVPKEQDYASLVDFFTERGDYKLAPYLEDAYKAQVPNAFQKEFKETDQRVNLLYNTIEGYALRIFPVPDNDNNKWIAPIEYKRENYKEQINDSLYGNFVSNGFSAYLFTLNQAKKSGDFSKADELLESFRKTQHKYGSSVMLSDKKVDTEILYNKYDIFKKLFSWYMYASSLLFILLIIQIFKDKSKPINITVNAFKIIIVILFVLHTLGLIARWYISGHAPWSDAYESMIYVAWATMFFGLIFGRKSDLTLAATAFVTSMLLMVAHWSWMDPAIANLQPVLDSYWLMIHVAVIVASYGPFTLGMVLGLTALFLMIFTNKDNKQKMLVNINELTIINEMALTVGLVMLTIGNFLGGMWANESWGRYWGWDPKETWALISIMIYAFVIHMRLVPGLRGKFAYNLASVIAIASIIFTYFGVNFYLSGLHSYQSGQQIASFNIIGIAVAIITIIAFFAYKKYIKFYKK